MVPVAKQFLNLPGTLPEARGAHLRVHLITKADITMGQLESEFQFTGRLGSVTAYRMRAVDKIIVRKKGGPSRERILKERSFARTRENNTEFSGRAGGVRGVRLAIAPLIFLADYNLAGHINKVLKYMQDRDTVNARGKRSILFSQYGTLYCS